MPPVTLSKRVPHPTEKLQALRLANTITVDNSSKPDVSVSNVESQRTTPASLM